MVVVVVGRIGSRRGDKIKFWKAATDRSIYREVTKQRITTTMTLKGEGVWSLVGGMRVRMERERTKRGYNEGE